MTHGRYKARSIATAAFVPLLQIAVLALPRMLGVGSLRWLADNAPLSLAVFLSLDGCALLLAIRAYQTGRRGQWDSALGALDAASFAMLAAAFCACLPLPAAPAWQTSLTALPGALLALPLFCRLERKSAWSGALRLLCVAAMGAGVLLLALWALTGNAPAALWTGRAAFLWQLVFAFWSLYRLAVRQTGELDEDAERRRRLDEYALISQHYRLSVLRYDLATRTLHCEKDTQSLLSLPEALSDPARRIDEMNRIAPQSLRNWSRMRQHIRQGKNWGSAVIGYVHPEKGVLWLQTDYVTVKDARGEPEYVALTLRLIEGMQSREDAYRQRCKENDRLAQEGAVYYEFNLTQDRIITSNGTPFYGMPGEPPSQMQPLLNHLREHMVTADFLDAIAALMERERLLEEYRQDVRVKHLEFTRQTVKEVRWTRLDVRMLGDPYSNDVLAFFLFTDIEQEKERTRQEKRRSNTDELTGLLGRAAFVERFSDLCAHSGVGDVHAIIMLDVDGFKAVNDTFGHGFGDKVLAEVADELASLARSDDMIARLGGDEFILCLQHVPADHDFVIQRCLMINHALCKQYGDEVAISASIGIALYPEHGATFDALYRHADQALYRAKEAGRNRSLIYNPVMDHGQALASEVRGENYAPQRMEQKPDTLLVVDDQRMNRAILREMFKDSCRVLEAENGKEAMEILQSEQGNISVIILDLIMPVMDGLEVLAALQKDATLQAIPVVVVSAADEEAYSTKAMALGAQDFVVKPVEEALVRMRVRNAIARQEAERLRNQNRDLLMRRANEERYQRQLQYVADHDSLTHIFNKAAFYRKARYMLDNDPVTEFCIICFDVLRFRAVNDIFGHEEGDRLLRYIATQLQALTGERGICARVGGDIFAMFLPYREDDARQLMDTMTHSMKSYDIDFDVRLCFGVYRIDDRALPINQMQDRAVIAERTVKNSYFRNVAYYNDTMSIRLHEEQDIINDMAPALQNHEFQVYYQPKCRLDTGKTVGAEALARWNHHRRGLLTPGSFVPIFERNGLIMRLDEYMWEQVCVYLGERLRKNPEDDLCVSVNISRATLYNPNLVATLNRLCRQYGVPNSHMNVEITESAYAENPQLLLDLTEQLHNMGFVVEMDDFGSGYSSLNMLKELPVDVLKLDMRFLFGIQNDQRGGSIISSVIDMARKLKIGVISEGVENEEQARFLATINCKLAQGYYYHKPMPEKELTALLQREQEEESSIRDEEGARLYLGRLLTSAILVRRDKERLTILAANEYYFRLIHVSELNFSRTDHQMSQWIASSDELRLKEAMDDARMTRKPAQCVYVQQDLHGHYHLLDTSVVYVTDQDGSSLYVLILSDIG